MLTISFILFCALWRLWLGGVPHGLGPTWLKHVAGFAAVFGLLGPDDPVFAGVNALLFLAYWRAMGHGPMLRYPLGPDDGDYLRKLASKLPEDQAWWVYASIRYVGFALVWGCVIWLVQAVSWSIDFHYEPDLGLVAFSYAAGLAYTTSFTTWPLLLAGIGICIAYRVTANAKLPYGWIDALGGVKPGERADGYTDHLNAHYAEPIAGALIGAALVYGVT